MQTLLPGVAAERVPASRLAVAVLSVAGHLRGVDALDPGR
jgi:hypothetical protein